MDRLTGLLLLSHLTKRHFWGGFAYRRILEKPPICACNRFYPTLGRLNAKMRSNRTNIEKEKVTIEVQKKNLANWYLSLAKPGIFPRFCTLFSQCLLRKSHTIFSNKQCLVDQHDTMCRPTRHYMLPETALEIGFHATFRSVQKLTL